MKYFRKEVLRKVNSRRKTVLTAKKRSLASYCKLFLKCPKLVCRGRVKLEEQKLRR